MTYKTRFCPRMFRDVPYHGCNCVDCWAIYIWRWFRGYGWQR